MRPEKPSRTRDLTLIIILSKTRQATSRIISILRISVIPKTLYM